MGLAPHRTIIDHFLKIEQLQFSIHTDRGALSKMTKPQLAAWAGQGHHDRSGRCAWPPASLKQTLSGRVGRLLQPTPGWGKSSGCGRRKRRTRTGLLTICEHLGEAEGVPKVMKGRGDAPPGGSISTVMKWEIGSVCELSLINPVHHPENCRGPPRPSLVSVTGRTLYDAFMGSL
jgi:hypothetical protein